MKFRLTYEGELRPTQRDALEHEKEPLAIHKHTVRRVFHAQLKRLWQTNRTLSEWKVQRADFFRDRRDRSVSDTRPTWASDDPMVPLSEVLAESYQMFGYHFVPLVRKEIGVLCSLDFLFLRRDIPGSAVQAGDIDNRIKTLIDTLRMPRSPNEMLGSETPLDGEDPFFCLLEDDNLVSHFAVETDTLLDPLIGNDVDQRRAKIVVTVEIRPYHVTMDNLSFA